jgi:hypothetical protein
MRRQPLLDLFGAAGGEVVRHRDDLLPVDDRDLGVELLEEPDQVPAVAGLGRHREHVAVVDLQRGEQALGAVARVLVLAPGRPARHGRVVGLDRRFGLDTGLLIDRDDQYVLGRRSLSSPVRRFVFEFSE